MARPLLYPYPGIRTRLGVGGQSLQAQAAMEKFHSDVAEVQSGTVGVEAASCQYVSIDGV